MTPRCPPTFAKLVSPLVVKLPVAGSLNHRGEVADSSQWHYDDLRLPFVLTSPLNGERVSLSRCVNVGPAHREGVGAAATQHAID